MPYSEETVPTAAHGNIQFAQPVPDKLGEVPRRIDVISVRCTAQYPADLSMYVHVYQIMACRLRTAQVLL
jgi:hypothetical protein